jgi:DNA-binding NtrC family response regulator
MSAQPASILLVEDNDGLRNALHLTLDAEGYAVTDAPDARAAQHALAGQPFDVVLTDLKMPYGSGLEVLRAAKEHDKDANVIVMTAYGSIEEAVEAIKVGAIDFLQKPVDTDHLLLLIERALEQTRLRTENILLREEFSKRYGFPRIIGESAALKRATGETQKVAATDATVLLLGESGTGKELFARAVHHLSPRRAKPFVAINCAAIPETLIENELFGHEKGAFTGASDRRLGKFELANGGTIFLDEIGEMPLSVQGKLLRVLEEKTIDRVGGRLPIAVDVRVVAATNRSLSEAAHNGEFRLDLFYRLAVFPIEIPPLRERGADVVTLAAYFAHKFGKEVRGQALRFSEESLTALRSHHFPGNVRELANLIERACILADSDTITPQDLGLVQSSKFKVQSSNSFDLSGSLQDVSARAVRLVESRKIRETLELCDGNKTRAADALGVSYKTLLTKIKDYELGSLDETD